jgi:hypothetical protein
LFGGFIAAGLAVATPAAAQPAPLPATTATQVPAAGCELHAWPGPGLRVVFNRWHGPHMGGLLGYAIDEWTKSLQHPPGIPADTLGTTEQAKMMGEVDIAGLLGLDGYRLVVHDRALDSKTIRTASGRIDPSVAPCYAELMSDGVFLEKGIGKDAALKTVWRYRQFDSGASATRSFSSFSQQPLKLFPPDGEHPEEVGPSLVELRQAYRNDIALFAQYVRQPVVRTKKR